MAFVLYEIIDSKDIIEKKALKYSWLCLLHTHKINNVFELELDSDMYAILKMVLALALNF